MYNFKHYYHLRQAGYDPQEVGRGFLRTIRSTLKDYVKTIESKGNDGVWGELRSNIQELYNTLSSPHDLQTLFQETERHIYQFKQMQVTDRMQDGMRLYIIRMLEELRNHIADNQD